MAQDKLISIVDDDPSVRAALAGLVRALGHAVRAYESADALLDAAPAGQPDCIVSDIHMPGVDGFGLLRALAEAGSPVPVILITARPQPGLRERAIAAGAIDLLHKPFQAEELIACLERAMAPL